MDREDCQIRAAMAKPSSRRNSIMFVAKMVPSPPSLVNTGIAMIPGYTTVPAAALALFDSDYQVRFRHRLAFLLATHGFGQCHLRGRPTVFLHGEPRFYVLAAMRILGMCLTMALLRPVFATASIPPRSSSIGKPIRPRLNSAQGFLGFIFEARHNSAL